MYTLLSRINVSVSDQIYLKDPSSTNLGKQIVAKGIELIDEIGFEEITFKKLAASIGSTEASVYRYFENKHKLLLYLTAWYWGWIEYYLVFSISNIDEPEIQLSKAISILTESPEIPVETAWIDIDLLHKILVSESSKSYLTKYVDEENKEGAFEKYKEVVDRVSDIILKINPSYKYPHMLVSTLIEGSHHQRFFAEHLPRLTDIRKGEDSVKLFYQELVINSIKN